MDVLVATCVITMWLVAVVYIPGMRSSPVHMMVCLALVSGTTAVTVGQPVVRAWFLATTGWHWAALVLEMVLALVTMAAVLSWLTISQSLARGHVRRRLCSIWIRTAVIAVIAVPIAVRFDLEADATYAAIGHGQASVAQTICVGAYESYMIYTFVQTARMFLDLGRASASRWNRYNLYVIGLSAMGSQGRSVYTMIYLLFYDVGLPPWSATLNVAINLPSHAIGCVGIALYGMAGAVQWARTRRELRAITPLWQAVRAAYPSVVRVPEPLPSGPQLMVAVTEIHDALGRLAGWDGSVELMRMARAAAVAAGVPADRVEAAAQAAWIAHVLRRGLDTSQVDHTAWSYGPSARDDMAGGVAWLSRISREFETPFVRQYAQSDPLLPLPDNRGGPVEA